MVSKSLVANSTPVLRILALVASVVTVALVGSDNFHYYRDYDINGYDYYSEIVTFKSQRIDSFRYVIAVAAMSVAYCVVQLLFAVYYAVQQKRLIPNGCFPDFDFYGDKVISLLLSTGTGAGIAVAFEFKKGDHWVVDPLERSIANKFDNRALIGSIFLFVAFLCMTVVSVISSISRTVTQCNQHGSSAVQHAQRSDFPNNIKALSIVT